jgi:hypothetical protein
MSVNLSSPTNNKSVLKHGGRVGDLAVSNGVEQVGIFQTQPSRAFTTFRGPKKLQVSSTAGVSDTIAARAMMIDDNYEIFHNKFNSETECKTGNGGLFIAEHDYWIDSIKFRTGSVNIGALSATLYKANSGGGFAGGTAITAAMNLATGTLADHVVTTGAILSDTARYVAKGQAVGLVFTGTPDQASGLIFSVKARRVIPGTRTENYLE